MSERAVGLRTQILAVVLGVAILPLALLGAWLTASGVRSGEQLLRDHLEASADRYISVVMQRWEYRQGDLGLLAGNEATIRAVSGETLGAVDRDFLDGLAEGLFVTMPTIEIRDAAGRVRWASSPLTRASSRPRELETAVPAATGPILQVRRPVLDESGTQIGEVTADVSIDALAPADSARPLVPGGRVAVRISATGRMLVPLLPTARYPVGGRTVINGSSWLVVHRALEGPRLDIAVGAPLGPYVQRFESASRIGSAALAGVIIAAVIAALMLTARLTRPLEELANASEAVTRGNLEHRTAPGGPAEVRRVGTAFNTMTENLRATLDQLSRRSALAAVGEFATSLSHDVRNALTSIRLDLERTERAHISEPGPRKLVERALGSVTRLEAVVTGALQVARVGSVPAVDLDLTGPIRDAAAAVMGTLSAIPANLDLDLPSEPLIVRGSSAGLHQVFANLLFNAAQALQPDGRVLVTGRRRDGMIEVLIADNGGGIDDELMASLAKPFTSSKSNGSGLGLPIARRIVAEHGGTLEMESAIGEGTVVRVVLPLMNGLSADIERTVPSPAMSPTSEVVHKT